MASPPGMSPDDSSSALKSPTTGASESKTVYVIQAAYRWSEHCVYSEGG